MTKRGSNIAVVFELLWAIAYSVASLILFLSFRSLARNGSLLTLSSSL